MIAKTHPDFPSDICLLLSTLGAKLTLMNASKKTEVVEIISFLSDSSLPRQDQAQIIHSVTIPFPGPDNFLDTFKVMRRHMNTHAEVNAGFLFQFNGGAEVASTRLVIGNIEHKPFVATETSKALLGKSLDSATISAASKVLEQELKAHLMEPTVPEPPFVVVDPQYRLSLATQLFVKAALRARMNRLGSQALSADERSAAEEPQRPASCGAQHFTVDHSTAPVGQPMEKFQGLDQACGTAQFVADTPLLPRTLFAVPILAERVALLQRIDAADCLEVTGVHSFISAADVKDVGASNDLKTTYPGKIFADAAEKTSHLGQFIGLVLAESFEAARSGARLVHVDYEESSEVTTTIDAAVQRGAVKERHGLLSVGAKVTGSQTLQGRLVSSGQKHLYLETQTTYAYHDCNGGLVFNTACQTLDWAQTQMAKTLNMPKSKITVQNQRLGGAYGGKAMLFAPVCGACGVAVLKSKRPVLLQMDRTLDFRAFGGRAPFDASWDLSHENGKIVSLKQEVLQNVGTDMLGFSQASSVNCYNIPHAQLHCKGVITNLPVNTWMRAPGDFEGAFIMEAIMEQVARAVGRDPVEVQELNLAEGMQKAWQRLKAKVAYEETRKAVKDFNSQSRYRKKGLYCMGSRYQLEPNTFMEKCFLRVHDDGSVLLEHTGLEVGQGIDTKALQACTMALRKIAEDFQMDQIQLRLPKTTGDFSWRGVMGTFSSVTSETVVSAILDACAKLQKELQKWIAPGRGWTEVISLATKGGAQLSQAGVTDQAAMEKYSLFSAGCAQVEIDVLTGETQVNSFDLVYDSGKSLNPAVDIGQIEGSLIQALGFSLLEEETRGKDGRLVNCGTWDYKVPSGNDIPVRLDVELLPCQTPSAPVLGSKASGEPAQLLGGAFFFAVKDAIGYAREEQGLSRNFRLDPPASPARIQAACSTQL
ncbi:unnamed protein product [Durusdinium trenchii]|uniref:Xanthine dehydrogenase n=1 Tax=Durusdinium trenchii TaxID=1381693 RepID=A0ABP0IFS6_9DINO